MFGLVGTLASVVDGPEANEQRQLAKDDVQNVADKLRADGVVIVVESACRGVDKVGKKAKVVAPKDDQEDGRDEQQARGLGGVSLVSFPSPLHAKLTNLFSILSEKWAWIPRPRAKMLVSSTRSSVAQAVLLLASASFLAFS